MPFTVPTAAVTDDGDGSVTIVIANNAGQTSRIYYSKRAPSPADSGWTLHTTTQTGNGTVSDLTTLTIGNTYMFMVIPYDSVSGAFGVPALTVYGVTMSGPQAGKPTRLVRAKQKLVQRKVLSEDRDTTITQSVYACMVGATLANQNLKPGDALPDDAASIIMSSRLLPASGTAEQQIEAVARKARAYV